MTRVEKASGGSTDFTVSRSGVPGDSQFFVLVLVTFERLSGTMLKGVGHGVGESA